MRTHQYAVVFENEIHGPFADVISAHEWAKVNGGKVRPLRAPSPLPKA